MEIAFQRGVCGAAFFQKRSMIVEDVQEFSGHIACDPESKSEMVLPFWVGGQLLGVLDVDSPLKGRFSEDERILLESSLEILARKNSKFQGLLK